MSYMEEHQLWEFLHNIPGMRNCECFIDTDAFKDALSFIGVGFAESVVSHSLPYIFSV